MKQHCTDYWWLFSLVILLISAGWIFISRTDSNQLTRPQHSSPYKGFVAPDFTLVNADGDSVSLSDLTGQPVVLNFWATWCPPCRTEMPGIQNVYRDFAHHGLEILAINSTNQDDLDKVNAFVDEYHLTFPVLLDQQGLVSDIYNIRALPTSFFVGRDGIIKEVVIGGSISKALLRIHVERLLK